jgi:serine/threonine-protein kinase HipA
LRTHSSQPENDAWTFVDALVFNWLIGGADAHAKNYSVLHGAGGRVRLAPLYDLASVLPYDALATRDVRLSMGIGGTYRLAEIQASAWQRLAAEIAVSADDLTRRIVTMAQALPEKLAIVVAQSRLEGIDHPILERLLTVLTDRADQCQRSFG